MSGLGRRQLLKLNLKPATNPQRLPWTVSELAFIDGCSRCGACLKACPEQIIKPGEGGFPELDFSVDGCTFCQACAEACPEPLFRPPDHPPWQQYASIGKECFTFRGVVCQSCGDACETDAIRFDYLGRVPQPRLDTDACSGCGACVAVCPQQAIRIHALQGD